MPRLCAISSLSFSCHVTLLDEFSSDYQDYLNEKLQECFLQRIRHAMKPDEAFGLIFSWDNVIVSCCLVLVYHTAMFSDIVCLK